MMNSLWSGQWLPLFINTVLQSLFVLAAAAIVLACARKASAARRHLIATAAMGLLLLIPIVNLLMPAPKPLLQVSGEGSGLRRSPARALSAPVRIERVRTHADRSNLTTQADLSSVRGSAAAPTSPGVIVSAEAAPRAGSPPAASGALVRFVPCLAALWLMGVCLVLGRLLIGFHRVRRLAQLSDSALPEPLRIQLKAILAEAEFACSLTIVQASRQHSVSVPMTWGVRPATLLLPADAGEWPAERLRVVVLHELAHIRRYDWLTQMLGQIVCALYWFHPLVWLLYRRTQIEAEHACDDAVLLAGVRAKEYASHLLDVVKAMQSGREAPSAAVAMARPMQVHSRLQSILNARRSRQSITRSVRTLVLLVTALLLCAVSGFRPLAWARARQQATEAGQTPPSGPVVTLPNGVSVELAAVGSDPLGGGDDWWMPNGKPLLEAPISGPTFLGRGQPLGDQYLRRSLFFRLHTSQEAHISTTGYVVDPTKHLQKNGYNFGRDARLNYDNGIQDYNSLMPGSAATGIALLGFPPEETHCTYRFGIATGPWETIATTRFALHPTQGAITLPTAAIGDEALLFFDDKPCMEYRDGGGKWHLDSLLGAHAPLGDVARRIIALDKDGKQIELPVYSSHGPLPNLVGKLARVVEIRLQTRPYQWAEFKDIVLVHPPVTPAAIPTPTTLAAFRHTFACGITLTIPAITEKRVDGGRWWKPDGQPLAGPLKEYGNSVSFQSWEHGTHPRIMLLQLKSPRALAYTSAVRFPPSDPDYNEGIMPGVENRIEKSQTIPTWTGRDFPQNLPQTTLRYGIAAGPWKTVAVTPMPPDVRYQSNAKEPNQGDINLEMLGYPRQGDVPKLSYTTSAGKSRALHFKVLDPSCLSDAARRFVAVDQAGNLFPLLSNSGFRLPAGPDGNPIPLDPANIGKTNLRARDCKRRVLDMVKLSRSHKGWVYSVNPIDLKKVREFRLQVRPYEWAEFPNVALHPTTRAVGQ